nr:MATE family efflux transporter [Allobaculum sp. Allo2]
MIQGAINGFGASVMAGYSASIKLNNLVITSLTTLANGISNYTAQNIGANKLHRIRAGFNAGLRLVWGICLPSFWRTFSSATGCFCSFSSIQTAKRCRRASKFYAFFLRSTSSFPPSSSPTAFYAERARWENS